MTINLMFKRLTPSRKFCGHPLIKSLVLSLAQGRVLLQSERVKNRHTHTCRDHFLLKISCKHDLSIKKKTWFSGLSHGKYYLENVLVAL